MAIWFLVLIQMLRGITLKGFLVGMLVWVGVAYGWKFYVVRHYTPPASNGMPTQGHVVNVIDGDTLTILDPAKNIEHIRIASIDAPELAHGPTEPGQPFGVEARAFLDQWGYQRDVALRCYERDRYGRLVCDVWRDPEHESAGRELARMGLAWSYQMRGRQVQDYNIPYLAAGAQRLHLGLWGTGQHPVAPWRWRHECWQQRQCSGELLAAAASP